MSTGIVTSCMSCATSAAAWRRAPTAVRCSRISGTATRCTGRARMRRSTRCGPRSPEVLAAATGIPVFKLTEEESQRLLRMEDELHRRVIGQNVAVKSLSQAIRSTRAGLKDPKRPGGSFIFAGPSGVGKTELSRTLADFLFGDEDSLIQLDMSEYMEKHTVS